MNPVAERLREQAKNMREAAKAAKIIDQREEAWMYSEMAKDDCRRAAEVGQESLKREAARFEKLADVIDKEADRKRA